MSTILHISDLHFGTERPPVVRALLQLARELKPDLLLITGDITQRARRAQFREAAAFVEALAAPAQVIVSGNHDVPLYNLFARALHPFRNYRRAFGANLEPDFASDDLLVLGVNSTRPQRHTRGSVSVEQIERVSARLRAAAPDQLRIVAMHHPVLAISDGDRHNLLHNRAAALRAWALAGADLIIGGHIHLPYVRPLPDLPRSLWTVQAGTATSWRVRGDAPNS
ncbi:conserved hypothetical protein, partial [Ricinus communis]